MLSNVPGKKNNQIKNKKKYRQVDSKTAIKSWMRSFLTEFLIH